MSFLTVIFLRKSTSNLLLGLLIQQIRFANFSVLYMVLSRTPRASFAKFSTTIHDFGFTSSSYDFALFVHKTAQGTTLLLLYVDDMIITGNDTNGILSLKQFFRQYFEMKDLDCKTTSTPIDPQTRLTPLDGTLISDHTLYRQLVSNLVYLTVTRPNIAYAVHLVSQYLSAPCTLYHDALLDILHYPKGTLFRGLHYSARLSPQFRVFSDTDWAGDPTDHRSTTSFYFFLGDSLITWCSKKQTLTARSSTKAEYRVLANTTQEFIWLRWLLADMGVSSCGATSLYCDN
ncbi:uncharacterized protein LOC114275209 [Camellia sinensis]|uniref:uncharacterized protein LOC114275209 n=1 Tax=Camellia sinensis TaxID=4442 RepID=UPI001036BFEC|nr:uncharacterized protein LOC114275209 [Camellia sinensis]